MEQNETVVLLHEEIEQLRSILETKHSLSISQILKRHWIIGVSDDTNLFNIEAKCLAFAMKFCGHQYFYIADTSAVLEDDSVSAFRFEATQAGIESFQGDRFIPENLFTCLYFSRPLDFVVLRTGSVDYILYAGSAQFVSIATTESAYYAFKKQEHMRNMALSTSIEKKRLLHGATAYFDKTGGAIAFGENGETKPEVIVYPNEPELYFNRLVPACREK